MSINEIIGKNIRKIRKNHHITQEDLARLSGMSVSHLSAIESGKQNPTVLTLERIAVNLDTTIKFLLNETFSEGLKERRWSLPAYQAAFEELPKEQKDMLLKIVNAILMDPERSY